MKKKDANCMLFSGGVAGWDKANKFVLYYTPVNTHYGSVGSQTSLALLLTKWLVIEE